MVISNEPNLEHRKSAFVLVNAASLYSIDVHTETLTVNHSETITFIHVNQSKEEENFY